MPSRVLRERYATSPSVAACSPGAQDRLPRYWLAADDLGCFDAHPPVVLGRLFPLRPDMTAARVEADLREYKVAGMLELYDARGGPWGFWRAWHRHQRHRPQAKPRGPIPPSVEGVGGFDAYVSANFPTESAAGCRDLPQVAADRGNPPRLAASRARAAAAAAAAAVDHNVVLQEEVVKNPPTPQGGESAPSDASSRARDSDTQIAEVWAYYCRVMERERVRKAVPGPVARKLKARLAEGVTADELRGAIRGCRRSPYHRGDNDTRTVYDSLALIARSADKVREFAGREEATRALHAEGKVHLSGGRWVYESRERGPIDLGPKREVWDGNGAVPPAGSDPGSEPAPEVLGPGHTRLPYQ